MNEYLNGSVEVRNANSKIVKFEGFNPYDSLFNVNAAYINEENIVVFVDSGFNNKFTMMPQPPNPTISMLKVPQDVFMKYQKKIESENPTNIVHGH